MPEKTGTMKFTRGEVNLIAALRARKIKHGRIPCIIYIQDSQLKRIEFKGEIESIKLE